MAFRRGRTRQEEIEEEQRFAVLEQDRTLASARMKDIASGDAESLQGVPVSDTAPTAGYVLVYNAATGEWEPTAASAPGAHVLATTAGLGASQTTSGLTVGQVLRATGATTAAFQAIQDADVPAAIARDAEVTSSIATHTAIAGAHHARYTDSEALAAVPYEFYIAFGADPINGQTYTP